MDLFDHTREQVLREKAPLAARMRPRTLAEYVGQQHILAPGRLLRRAIQADQLSSVIFFGPPGTGKTTLARIIANTTRAGFIALNAVLAGVADLRKAVAEAERALGEQSRRTILFIDEVHRFNKAQQDALLPHVENGTVILVGATTENPYFEVNKTILSRSRIFELRGLDDADIGTILERALADPERGYGRRGVRLSAEALAHLIRVSNGDARAALNALELAVETTPTGPDDAGVIDLAVAEESIQRRAVLYDKDGDAHFDTISAFIKALRGSDPDAALYWMARMLYAGEDPRFILRRMLIFAAEDVGLADPGALGVVAAAAQAFDYVGLPEGRFHLSEACLYLATAPKSNSTLAFFDALAAVERERGDTVPDPLKDGSRDAAGLGHGEGYLYPHAFRDHWVAQQYLPTALQGRVFYEPGNLGFEGELGARVRRLREAQLAAAGEAEATLLEPLGAVAGAQPAARGADWRVRSEGALAGHLEQVRARVFRLAQVGRAHLVLDAQAAGGLLTGEACRLAREGGVWCRVDDEAQATALLHQAPAQDALDAPVVLQATLQHLAGAVAARAGSPVRFDRILARGVLAQAADKPAAVALLARLLAGDGRLVLAEGVPRLGGRILAENEALDLPPHLARAVLEAEESLYADPHHPSLNWDEPDLRRWCEAAGLAVGPLERQESRVTFNLHEGLLEAWFGAPAGPPDPARGRLRQALGDVAEAVRAHLRQHALGRPITRRMMEVVLRAEPRG